MKKDEVWALWGVIWTKKSEIWLEKDLGARVFEREELQLFRQMAASRTKPNETTFVAVLTACTHAKMVQQGLWLFEEMSSVYGVVPRMEHYACVIDLLSRAGMVEEAEKFMEEKMGGLTAGDANVWGALLNACRIHKNIHVGNRVWKKLVDMGVTDCGTHVLTYNIYREAGWDVLLPKLPQIAERQRHACWVR